MFKLISPNFSHIFEPNIQVGKFPDGDSHVVIPNLTKLKNQDVLLFHRLYPKQNTNLLVFLFILDALKNAGVKTISSVCPYLPYARQDKQKLEGELVLAKTVVRSFKNAGLDKLITFDCHFLNEIGEQNFEGLNILNLSMGQALVEKAKEYFLNEPFEVIGPDEGSGYLVSGFGGQTLKKVRKEYLHGKVSYRDVHEISGDLNVKNKNVLILDDIISSGSTMLKALEKFTGEGAKKVAVASTHGLFLFDCLDKIKQYTDIVFCSDTIVNTLAQVSIKNQLTKF